MESLQSTDIELTSNIHTHNSHTQQSKQHRIVANQNLNGCMHVTEFSLFHVHSHTLMKQFAMLYSFFYVFVYRFHFILFKKKILLLFTPLQNAYSLQLNVSYFIVIDLFGSHGIQYFKQATKSHAREQPRSEIRFIIEHNISQNTIQQRNE